MKSGCYQILLADADLCRRDLLEKHLQVQGFAVTTAGATSCFQQILAAANQDLAIVDLDLPAPYALELIAATRADRPFFPLFALLSSTEWQPRVAALEAGADDVLSYPFALEEFTARIQALLRRASVSVVQAPEGVLRHRELCIDSQARSVMRAGVDIRLTVKEYDLLRYLLRHKEQVLPRKQILHAVWGDTWVGDDNLLDVYIRYLRKKIERPDLEPLIHTIRGVGFMLK